MGAASIIIISILILLVGYITYGTYAANRLEVDPHAETPAHKMCDGVDYVPAKWPVLLGHHFASIAGAAPIIGPIVAAAFGWMPVLLWLIIGGIFIGSVHDFCSLIASARHEGKSIGKIIEAHIGRSGKFLFLMFCWAALLLVIAVFTIVAAKTFEAVPSSASSSIMFILLAVMFGLTVYRWNVNLFAATVIGVSILFTCLWLGIKFPVHISINSWIMILLIYIFIASVTPVWILLQPRDYLNSFLLYAVMIFSVYGILSINPEIELPGFTGFEVKGLGYIFPVLFVTVACGAISGFHSLVASGTTSKQLDKETDAKIIGYGGMLAESLLGVVAMITAAVLTQNSYQELLKTKGPIAVFSQGIGQFMTTLHIPLEVGASLAALAVSAFALTSLDTAARLGRYTFQEFFHDNEKEEQSLLCTNKFIGAAITVIGSGSLAISGKWKELWPLFGSANQLLAAIAFLAISVWLTKQNKKDTFIKIPMFFMFTVTTVALIFQIKSNLSDNHYFLAIVGSMLLTLSIILAYQGYAELSAKSNNS